MNHNKYYDRLNAALTESLGINFSGYQPTKQAHRKARLYQKQLETRPEMSWSGDSASVPDVPQKGSDDPGIDAEHMVKQHVIQLMSAAQEKGIEMTHGEAHRMALQMLKQKVNK